MSNELIFGKDTTQNIVSVEIEDNHAKLFIQTNSGGIQIKTIPYKYWLLSDRNYGGTMTRLQGECHYKYMVELDTRQKYMDARWESKKRNYDMYSIYDPKESFMVRHGVTYFKGLKLEDVSILSVDIETNGVTLNSKSKIYTIANALRHNGFLEKKLFSIDDYETEKDMLADWMAWLNKADPTILVGHNLYIFDLPYLAHCIEKAGLDFNIGRENKSVTFNSFSSEFRKDGSQTYEYKKCQIYGREVVDTFFLSVKYDIGREFVSYGLKQIVKQLGLEKPDRTFIDASKIAELWEDLEMRKKIKDYNMDDVDDAIKLYDLMAPAFFYFTQSVPKSFQEIIGSATGSQINSMLVRSYLQQNHSVAATTREIQHIKGGISFAVPGIYKNLVKIDLKSAYPSQILRFKLYDKQKDPKGYLYEMTKYFTEQRLTNKNKAKETNSKYFKDIEQSQKIGINSIYGTLGTPKLNYNSPELAQKITEETRLVINQALVWASGKNVDYWMNLFKEKTE